MNITCCLYCNFPPSELDHQEASSMKSNPLALQALIF